jgi:hypothetical protein
MKDEEEENINPEESSDSNPEQSQHFYERDNPEETIMLLTLFLNVQCPPLKMVLNLFNVVLCTQ